jgi:hypothetical protein
MAQRIERKRVHQKEHLSHDILKKVLKDDWKLWNYQVTGYLKVTNCLALTFYINMSLSRSRKNEQSFVSNIEEFSSESNGIPVLILSREWL